jgi:hypothetical protein
MAGSQADEGIGAFDPDVERADEVEDYTDGIPRPATDAGHGAATAAER